MGSFTRQLRFGARSLLKSGGFTWVAVLLLGLGVGTVTSAFTVVDHVLLRPLPYPAEDRLVYMTNGSHSGPTLRRLDGVEAFEIWAAVSDGEVNLSRADGEPLQLDHVEATASFFTIFGARPAMGRLLVDADDDDPSVAVLSHDAWRTVWGGDPGIVGSTLLLDGRPVQVVGVLAEDFVPPERLVGRSPDLFRPMMWADERLQDPGFHAHSVVARLTPETTIGTADLQLDRVAEEVARAHADYYQGEADDWPLVPLREATSEDAEGGLLLLLAAVGLLLLVACANVAHLFMARGVARGREMAIRRALGADTGDLVTQLLAESLLVGLVGGALGLGLAHLSLSGFDRWTDVLPRGEVVSIDLRILLFVAALSSITAVLFGLVPALRTARGDLRDTLASEGRSSSGGRAVSIFRSGLVVAEVAVSLVLVTLAGLLVRSYLEVTGRDPGIDAADVWVAPINLVGIERPEEYTLRLEPVRRALASISGAEAVAYGFEAPFEYVGGNSCCQRRTTTVPGSQETVRTAIHSVSQGFFETFGTEIVAGRVWTPDEAVRTPHPVVISEAYAASMFGSAERAVGRSVDQGDGTLLEVVGVAEATLHYGADQPHDAAFYQPVEAITFPAWFATLAVRVRPETGGGVARRIREAVWTVEPDLPIPAVVPLESWVSESSAVRRLGSVLFTAFGAVALLLAAGGLYGTLLYNVGQQRRELGIRLALGETRGGIQSRVVRRGLGQTALGVAVGGASAVALGRVVESFLFGVSARDPVAFAGAATALLVTALVASWVPALLASRTDPMRTLGAE